VSSPARLRANRRNARKCTGPRTARGKARSSRNALRHGLSRSARFDPKLARVVATLAGVFAGEGASAEARACAARIALAHVEVLRARLAKRDLLVHAHKGGEAVKRMHNLDRYERRAMSRRKLAIRELDALARARPAAEAATELEAVLRLFGQTKPTSVEELREGAPPAVADRPPAPFMGAPSRRVALRAARICRGGAVLAKRNHAFFAYQRLGCRRLRGSSRLRRFYAAWWRAVWAERNQSSAVHQRKRTRRLGGAAP